MKAEIAATAFCAASRAVASSIFSVRLAPGGCCVSKLARAFFRSARRRRYFSKSTLRTQQGLSCGLRGGAALAQDGRCAPLATAQHVGLLLSDGRRVLDGGGRRGGGCLGSDENRAPVGGNAAHCGCPSGERLSLSQDAVVGVRLRRWLLPSPSRIAPDSLSLTHADDQILPSLGNVRQRPLVGHVVIPLSTRHSNALELIPACQRLAQLDAARVNDDTRLTVYQLCHRVGECLAP